MRMINGLFRSKKKYKHGVVKSHNMGGSIFIHRMNRNYALDGDTVEISNITKNEKGYEGKINKITKRKEMEYFGFIKKKININEYIISIHNIDIKTVNIMFIPENELNKKNIIKKGDYVKVKYIENTNEIFKFKYIEKIINLFYNINSVDIIGLANTPLYKKIFHNNGEKLKNDENNLKFLAKNYKDLTNQYVISIDPNGSKDLDDAFYIKKITSDKYKIYVHISDVSSYIKKKDLLYNNAKDKCLTYYCTTEKKNFPLFPKQYSENLFSILQNKKTNVCTVEFDLFNKKICNVKIYKSVIINKKQYNYNNFDKVEGKVKSNAYEIFLILKEKLKKNFNLDLPYLKYVIKYNNVIDVKHYQNNWVHKFIELLMIQTNKIISEKLLTIKKGIFRNHKINNIQFDINKKNIEEKLLYVKQNLTKAKYNIFNEGHNALNLCNYAHFTSPIRRFTDLVNQYIIFDEENFSNEELNEICEIANDIEKKCNKSKRIIENLLKIFYYKYISKNKIPLVGKILYIDSKTIEIFIKKTLNFIYLPFNILKYNKKIIIPKDLNKLKNKQICIIPYNINIIDNNVSWKILSL